MKIKCVDSTFSHNPAMTLAGENTGQTPTYFEWDFMPGPARVKVFTDIRLQEAVDDPAEVKVGLLIEPIVIASQSYATAYLLREHFDLILTHNKFMLTAGKPFAFYPFGGSWIKEWGIFEKHNTVSVITSLKHNTEGQKMRHHVVKEFPSVFPFGQPYTNYLPSKVPMLRPFRYSIVIENDDADYWFTEKLIDCLSQGTVPIYRGCPSIGSFFDADGIVSFREFTELGNILQSIGEQDYRARMPAIEKNLELARDYRCAEDWIWTHYEDTFSQ